MGQFLKCICVSVFFFVSSSYGAALNFELRNPEVSSNLDELTRSKETFNFVELLERGKNSFPMRRQLLKDASRFAFISVPFWHNDSAGREFIELLSEKKEADPGFQIKIIQGWTSPFLSKGGGSVKGALKDIADQYLLWNSPLWLRRFSYGLLRGHLHDKFFIVDGKKMIMGGMNMTDEDAGGGSSPMGTHDVDLHIEGPAVHQATEIFLKLNQLGHYLKTPESFPPFKSEEVKALYDYFYNNVEDHDFYTVKSEPNPKPPFRERHRVHIPIRHLLSDPFYFPSVPSGDVGLRIIYDNPLVDRDPKTKKHFSKFFRTMKFVTEKSKRTLWISSPYLTFDKELMAFFVEAARRLEVRILTNSLDTTDRNKDYYRAQLSHYPQMQRAGIRIYEWKGNESLKNLGPSCQVTEWPGKMLHSKVVVLDNAVAFVGSNNINRRSKELNNEVMALVNDEGLAQKLGSILERAYSGETQIVDCGDSKVKVENVEFMTEEKVRALWSELKVTKPIWNYSFGG